MRLLDIDQQSLLAQKTADESFRLKPTAVEATTSTTGVKPATNPQSNVVVKKKKKTMKKAANPRAQAG